LYSSPSIIRAIKSGRLWCAGHVAGMGRKRDAWFSSFTPGNFRTVTLISRNDHIFNKKFWERLIAYFPLTRHGPHRRGGHTDTQTARCLAMIRGDIQAPDTKIARWSIRLILLIQNKEISLKQPFSIHNSSAILSFHAIL
jgi:hypothetical protein